MRQTIHPIPIPNVDCRVCREVRRDDGLKCPHCQSYQNPEAGKKIRSDYEFGGFSAYDMRNR